jgi:hypothetical protein
MRSATEGISSTYKCLFMLITNKRVPKLENLLKVYRDLIIVDNRTLIEYFGPTVATYGDLVAFDEIKLTNRSDHIKI